MPTNLTRLGHRLQRLVPILGAASMLAASSVAQAQEIVMMEPARGSAVRSSPVTKLGESPILPPGRLELGGELVFVTAASDLEGESLRFTDVGLLPLHARFGATSWLQVDMGSEFLIKQPEHWDEPFWQGAFGGLRVPFGSVFGGAVYASHGRLMQGQGGFWQVDSTLLAKLSALDELRFELRAGHLAMALDYEDVGQRLDWLHEVIGHAEIQVGEKQAGAWIAADYAVPIDHSSGQTDTRPAIDPSVRLSLEFGGVVSPEDTNWDFYAVYSIIDRGSVDAPGSTLPVVDGGFDQRQWILGVQHRFELVREKRALLTRPAGLDY